MTTSKQDLVPIEIGQQLKQLTKHQKFLVALSGGMDSHVLLDLLVRAVTHEAAWQVRAVHINHQLNTQADQWARHCQQICAAYAIPLTVIEVQINCSQGESVEAQARQLRYAALAGQLQADECLLTAHHQDDQAETLLLQLLRGAGPKGLASMPARKQLAKGIMLRPLLSYTQAQLQSYAKQVSLEWIEDDSNQDARFARNYLRHQVMPVLAQRWPQLSTTLARSAAHCAEQCELTDELAIIDLASAWCDVGVDKIKWAPLRALSLARKKNALRYWLAKNNCLMPQGKQLAIMIDELISARSDAAPMVKLGIYAVRRYQEHLHIMRANNLQHDVLWKKPWNLQGQLKLPANLGVLSLVEHVTYCLRTDFAWDKISVRFRQGGERISLHGEHSQSLKNLFQQWRVPPWQREVMPLLFFEDQLIVVVGYAIAHEFKKMSPGKVVGFADSKVLLT